jgi:beta-N-acetylhexosaminidase
MRGYVRIVTEQPQPLPPMHLSARPAHARVRSRGFALCLAAVMAASCSLAAPPTPVQPPSGSPGGSTATPGTSLAGSSTPLPASASPTASTSPATSPTASPSAAPTPTPDPVEEEVSRLLASMSDEQKVGQLMLAGYSGTDAHQAAAELVEGLGVGGIILFADNVTSPFHARSVTAILRGGAGEVPLMIAVDHEGGDVNRFGPPVTHLPEAWAIGTTGDPALARAAGGVAGEELLAMGIGVDLAPVLDVNDEPTNPVIGHRAFGADAAVVTEMGLAFAEGVADEGVVPVAKHFPGHGHTTTDSHVELPVVTRDRDDLERIDIAPFRAAINDGIEMVMTAHVVYTALDPDVPATLSRPILTGLLREELGFDGVIVTDSLSMAAVARGQDPGRVALRAVKAGADLVLVQTDVRLVRDALLAAVRSGDLPRRRLDQSVERILRLKVRHAADWERLPDMSTVGSAAHQKVVDEILARASGPGP